MDGFQLNLAHAKIIMRVGIAEKVFKVIGQSSTVKVIFDNHLRITLLEFVIVLARGRHHQCTIVWMVQWRRHTFFGDV